MTATHAVIAATVVGTVSFPSICQWLHQRWFAWFYQDPDRTVPIIRITERRPQP